MKINEQSDVPQKIIFSKCDIKYVKYVTGMTPQLIIKVITSRTLLIQ